MRITRAHLDFWQLHHRPRWAGKIPTGKGIGVSPDQTRWSLLMACVDGHGEARPLHTRRHARRLELQNTIHLIRRWRDFRATRGFIYDQPGNPKTLREYLAHLARDGNSGPRIMACRRWLRRLQREGR